MLLETIAALIAQLGSKVQSIFSMSSTKDRIVGAWNRFFMSIACKLHTTELNTSNPSYMNSIFFLKSAGDAIMNPQTF